MPHPQQAEDISWQQEILQPEFLSQLQWLSTKRFGETGLAEEAYTASLEKMLDPDWQSKRFSSYRGVASPKGFLRSVFKMVQEDFARKRFGRPRPPVWLKRLGAFYERVYVLLCLERLDPEVLVARICLEHPRHGEAMTLEAIAVIRVKIPKCGEYTGEISHDFSNDESLFSGRKQGSKHTLGPEERLASDMLTDVFQGLAIMLGRGEEENTIPAHQVPQVNFGPMAENAVRKWQSLGDAVSLLPAERLLLKMVYQDGLTVSAVARLLKEKDHNVRRHLQDIVARLRRCLEEAGINAEVIRDALKDKN